MASRTSSAGPSAHSKPCSHCGALRDVLVRCQIDQTRAWVFVCPGKCWRELSGGQIDGDDNHPDYRYGGMWKNKHDAVSAKKKTKKNSQKQLQQLPEWRGSSPDIADHGYTRNDRVIWDGNIWTCRKTHAARNTSSPDHEFGLWRDEGPATAEQGDAI